ncbi:helix-turn-helix transcriptional regulator [Streptacidiphilus monticola]
MNRPELADFLRRCRVRLAPGDVGLPAGARRRTPKLRREEVAQLAGMSVDYYTRLEQRRGPHPSVQLLASLARALRLSDDERDHLFHLAGQQPPRSTSAAQHVRPGLLLVLDRLWDCPAQVISDIGDVLAQNDMAKAVFGPARGGNLVRRWFTQPECRTLFPEEDHERLARTHVAQLRAVSAARPEDRRVRDLVRELLAASPEFEALWARHDVAVRRTDHKRILHPVVGELDLDCEVLATADTEQRLVVESARPGTEAAERLELLRVVGLQDLGSSATRTEA